MQCIAPIRKDSWIDRVSNLFAMIDSSESKVIASTRLVLNELTDKILRKEIQKGCRRPVEGSTLSCSDVDFVEVHGETIHARDVSGRRVESDEQALEHCQRTCWEYIRPRLVSKKARGNLVLSYLELRAYVARALAQGGSNSNHVCVTISEHGEEIADPSGFAAYDVILNSEEARARLVKVLSHGKITEFERNLLVAHYLREISLKDLAESWDMPYSNLKSRHTRLMSRLRVAADELGLI